MDSFPRNELPPLESMNRHCETSYNYNCQQKMMNIEMREAVLRFEQWRPEQPTYKPDQQLDKYATACRPKKHALFAEQSQD
jgi:hypothetical protein